MATPCNSPAGVGDLAWLRRATRGGGANVAGASFAGSVSGGTLVAQDSNSLVVPVDGFSQSSVTYFPNPADAGLAGRFLQLRLCALDNSRDLKMTGYVAFDDVQLEEFAAPALAHWDLNDTGAGAGGAAPGGTWDAAGLRWNAVADGSGTAAPPRHPRAGSRDPRLRTRD